jgi:hypothetical protein
MLGVVKPGYPVLEQNIKREKLYHNKRRVVSDRKFKAI